MKQTLEQAGTPWAEIYIGSGRFTGRTTGEPTRMDTGEVAPNFTWVGNMTQEELDDEFERGEHDQLHSEYNADPWCKYCREADWIDE